MLNKILIASGVLGLAFVSNAAAQTPSPPAVYKSGADLMAIIKSKIPTTPDQADAPIDNPGPYRINVVRRGKPGTAMAHTTGAAKGTEVHYIIDGAATVVTGGTIVRPAGAPEGRGGAGATIQA